MKFPIRPLTSITLSAVAMTALSIIPASAETLSVKSGDTLWKLAHSHHTSVRALEMANPHVDPLNLRIGSVLNFPSSSKDSNTKASTQHKAQAQSKYAAPVTRASKSMASHAVAAPTTGSNDDVYWLAKLIHAEAVAEPYDAQIAVGDVVMHRVAEPSYPKTVKGVIFQISNGHYQFTCVQNGFINTAPTSENFQAARDVIYGHKDLVPGAQVFYNPAQTPATSWVRKQPYITSIGSFVFAK